MIDFEKAIVALTAWREMSGEGVNAMLAVVFVLRRRAELGWNGGSLYNNAIAKNQFSSMSVMGDPNTVRYPDIREPGFQTLLQKVEDIYEGAADNLTNGACYYCVPENSTSGWFKSNILDRPDEHPRCAVIGKTFFFK